MANPSGSVTINAETLAFLESMGTLHDPEMIRRFYAVGATEQAQQLASEAGLRISVGDEEDESKSNETERASSPYIPRARNSIDQAALKRAYGLSTLFGEEESTLHTAMIGGDRAAFINLFKRAVTNGAGDDTSGASAGAGTGAGADESKTSDTTIVTDPAELKSMIAAGVISGDRYTKPLSEMKLTPLHIAVMVGDVDAARDLLQVGAKTSSTDKRGWTPLHHAALSGNAHMLALLEENSTNATKKRFNHCNGTYRQVLDLTYPVLDGCDTSHGFMSHPRPVFDLYSLALDWRNPVRGDVPNPIKFKKAASKANTRGLCVIQEGPFGNALFAKRKLKEKTFIGYYGGDSFLQGSRDDLADIRYMFSVDKFISDGRKIGGETTRINHSFPNVVVINLRDQDGMPAVPAFFTTSAVAKGDQLCFDYGTMQEEERVELRPKAAANFIEWLGKSAASKGKGKKKRKGKRAAKKASMTNLEYLVAKLQKKSNVNPSDDFTFYTQQRQLFYILMNPMHCIAAYKNGVISQKHFQKGGITEIPLLQIQAGANKEFEKWFTTFPGMVSLVPLELREYVADSLEDLYRRTKKVSLVKSAVLRIVHGLVMMPKEYGLGKRSKFSGVEIAAIKTAIDDSFDQMRG